MNKCDEPNCVGGKSEKLIDCSSPFCNMHFHLTCANLKGMKKSEINNLYFLCNKCNEFVNYCNHGIALQISNLESNIKNSLLPISNRLDKIESTLTDSIDILSKRVDNLELANKDEKDKIAALTQHVDTIKNRQTLKYQT